MDSRQDTSIVVELALLVALATLWGSSYTFIKLGVAHDGDHAPFRPIAPEPLGADIILHEAGKGRHRNAQPH